ncbi:M14 family metallocarboxypeptidase [Nitrosomonas sp. Nm166]|uniref:M14 family metallopeptidase n=1 Tax=Nitrosomonas sp. Nm166 TaxID=1881054 RepID=UPI0008DED810|nr:M14 family metallocarboxypeptidase [Nitrosomonas sp. Nm166]SFE03750.1 Zinc carboxypeptidase [Nitrosomonas sp. Nm166]
MKLLYTLVFIFIAGAATALHATTDVATPLATPLETAHYTRISTSAEISAFMHALADRHPTLARVELIGDSVQGRPIEVIRLTAPHAEGATQRLKVMVIGSLHGAAEPAGGEALLVIARGLLTGDLRPLLDHLDVILLPNANPDGRDLMRRSNANGVNINTDFVLLSQPETRLLKKAVDRYAPDALLDSHESAVLKRETLAKDGYLTDFDAQFEISNNPAVPAALRDYALNTFLPALTARVSADGLTAHRYLGEIVSIKQPITNGGLTLRNFRNTAGMTGALSMLVETKLDSREDTFPTYRNIAVRVGRQLLCIRSFLSLVHERRTEIRAQTAAARAMLHSEPLILFAGFEVDRDNPKVWIPMRRLDTRELEKLEFRDHRKQVNADEVAYPPMLVITHHQDVIRPVLERHHVNHWRVLQSITAEVIAIHVKGRSNIVERAELLAEIRKSISVKPGDLFIDLAQSNGRQAALLLDPRSTSSIFRYPEFAKLVVPEEEFFIYHTFKTVVVSQP